MFDEWGKKKIYFTKFTRLHAELYNCNTMTKPRCIHFSLCAIMREKVGFFDKVLSQTIMSTLKQTFSLRLGFLLHKIHQNACVFKFSQVMSWKCNYTPLYTAISLNLEGNILKEFQLPHHHSISMVLFFSHLATKAQLQWKEKSMLTKWLSTVKLNSVQTGFCR